MTCSNSRAFATPAWRRLAPLLLALAFTPSHVLAQSVPSTAAPTVKAAPKTAAANAKPARPTATRESGPCGTGLIAAVGDVFTVQDNGIVQLGGSFKRVPVSWGFDDLIYARAKALGGDKVRRIAVPAGAFDPLYQSTSAAEANAVLPAIVKKVAGSAGCARYLVIVRASGREPSTYDTVSGIGVVSRIAGLVRYTHVFVMLGAGLFDGTTFEKLPPPPSSKSFMSRLTSGMGPPSHAGDVDNSAFPAKPEDAANNTVLRDMARSMLRFRLDQTLPDYFSNE
ncbi:hypothetical protein SSBR45G_26560 [Bradyrhizobium sp. SSBR45G]|nr:hypothetical protein SSBR45G_26560 [Bradyrhizobium sp. SSBR45G]GLH84985.1 hypothetical protein SSBR45R_24450 [Bradyrhizobium sp. SSBR45R]